jgi:hypothetical protein
MKVAIRSAAWSDTSGLQISRESIIAHGEVLFRYLLDDRFSGNDEHLVGKVYRFGGKHRSALGPEDAEHSFLSFTLTPLVDFEVAVHLGLFN